MRGYVVVGCISSLLACGGGKKPAKKPKVQDVAEPAKPETEADREEKRRHLAEAIIPQGSKCLPVSLKEDNAPRLELAAIGPDAIVCAVDNDGERLLGPVGCWKVDLSSGVLEYKEPQLLPSRGIKVRLDDHCARGYCMPKDAKLSTKIGYIAKSVDGSKVAVLVGDDVHLFDAESKEHKSSFTIRGDKGVTNTPVAEHFVGDTIVIEGSDDGPSSAVWVFKADGTPVGPVTSLGGKEEKPISTYRGSLSILDKNRIAVSEKGMETLTTYQVDNGARAKLVRKVPKLACKPAELDAFWKDGDKVTDKCKDSVMKASGYLMGATAVAGAKNFLVLLRGDRLGELGVLDAKTLVEKKAIKLPWCEGDGGGEDKAKTEEKADKKADKKAEKAEAESAPPPAPAPEAKSMKKAAAPEAASAPKSAPKKPSKAPKGDSSDPEEGGE